MIEARRRAYLEAMGFDVWVSRSKAEAAAEPGDARAADPAATRLRLGHGDGSTLVVCAEAAHSATKFAGDLSRALGGAPVWSWPDATGGPDTLSLEEAIRARLITRVVLLGPDLAERCIAGETPELLGSAAIVLAAGTEELAVNGLARQRLWARLRGSGKTTGARDR